MTPLLSTHAVEQCLTITLTVRICLFLYSYISTSFIADKIKLRGTMLVLLNIMCDLHDLGNNVVCKMIVNKLYIT